MTFWAATLHLLRWLVSHAPNWWTWFQTYLGGPLVVGLLVAWYLPRANQRFQSRREHLTKAVDALRAQLDSLRKITSTYWLNPYDGGASPAHEGEIEFLLQDVSALVNACIPYLWEREAAKGPGLVSDLALACTGPGFGVSGRAIDPRRIQRISAACSAITHEIVAKRSAYLH